MSDTTHRFRKLFRGLDQAFGTGDKPGRWIKRPPLDPDFVRHLMGHGPGIGIAPLMPDNRVHFAAIDMDEPDFDAAFDMQRYIPGASFVERSRSGNAHIWVFFSEPIEAWVPMGVLREVCIAAEKPHVEVFPKNHDFSRVQFGNYINLPYHGTERPMLSPHEGFDVPLETFLALAETNLNDPRKWRQRASLLMVDDPTQRKTGGGHAYGEQSTLHMCAEWIVEHAEDNPLTQGGRHDTIFALAKQFSNCRMYDHDETLTYLRHVNSFAQPPIADSELVRMLRNVEEHEYTSMGCDAPNVQPYAHPDCPIANG